LEIAKRKGCLSFAKKNVTLFFCFVFEVTLIKSVIFMRVWTFLSDFLSEFLNKISSSLATRNEKVSSEKDLEGLS